MQKNWLTISIVILASFWLGIGYALMGYAKSSGAADFAVYYAAAKVMAADTELNTNDIYNQSRFRILTKNIYPSSGSYFLYPPQAAVLLLPLAWLPFSTAKLYWLISNVVLLVTATLCWLLTIQRNVRRNIWWLPLFAIAPPVFSNIDTGQINIIVFVLFSVALTCLIFKRYPWLVGISLGLATMLKIFPIIFLPYLIIKKQYKAATGFAVISVLLTILSVFWFNLSGWKIFLLQRLPALLNGDIGHSQTSISLYGALRTGIIADTYSYFGDRVHTVVLAIDPVYKFAVVIIGVSLAAYLWYKRRITTQNQYLLEYSMIMLYIILTSEIVHQHYIVWLIPTLLWISYQTKNCSWWLRILFWLALGLVLFQKYIPWLDLLNPYIKPVTLGLLLLSGCVYYLIWSKDSPQQPFSRSQVSR